MICPRIKGPNRWLLILLFVLGIAGQVPASAQQAWDFGGHRFLITSHEAGPLLERAFGRAGLASMAILGRVGGINLEGTAVLDVTLASQVPQLRYDPSQPDGSRLSVTVGGKVHHPWLPDWQLKPIALLADSQYTADVSLFGDGPDREHFFYVQFHPALKDTLLGLRLLQADVMLIDPDSLRHVPEFNGHAVLGLGEQLPDEVKSAEASTKLQEDMAHHPIQSWILTDIDAPIRVTQTTDKFSVFAKPYYYSGPRKKFRICFNY